MIYEFIVLIILLVLLFALIGSLSYKFNEKINKVNLQASEENIIKHINDLFSKKEELQKMLENSISLLNQNNELRDRHKEYAQFFEIFLQVLNEDTEFLRGNLMKKFSGNIPEVAEFNSQVLTFQNRILMIKQALKDQKMISEIEEKETP